MPPNTSRRAVLTLLFAFASGAAACGGDGSTNPPGLTQAATRNETITVDGQVRAFVVYAPSGVDPTQDLPVVMMLHGSSGDGPRYYGISGWKEKCEAVKCLAVFPSSRSYCITKDGQQRTTTKWNAGDLPQLACAGQVLYDDVKFFRQMVAFLQANYQVDRKRIYVTGFSNGGSMSSLLWSSASDLFAAVAASAGYTRDLPAPASPVPMYYTSGEVDDNDEEKTPYVPMPMNATVFQLPWVANLVGNTLTKLGLTQSYTTQSTTNTVNFRFTDPASAGSEFDFMVVKGLDHQYANGNNSVVVYADIFWPFFARFSKP